MANHNFLVDRANLASTQLVDALAPEPGNGQVVLRVDRYALTANNITYGVAGDMIGYWQFFPADGGMGRIPVWGIGTVIASNCDGVEEGARYYGYYPMSSHLVVSPVNLSERGMIDGAEHRASLPPTYNQYMLMNEANGYISKYDNHQMVYWPLFATGFILDDYFDDNAFFGASQIVISSASSKTSFSMAYLLRERNIKVVGLTSRGNADFVSGLGFYDEVHTYDNVEAMDATVATAYVDMSGNREVLGRVHNHFRSQLVSSCGVGITHYDAGEGVDPDSLPGAKPAMFFAPTQMQKRHKDWGPQEYQRRFQEVWQRFVTEVDQWVTINEGPDVDATYQTVLAGARPDQAYVVVN